MAIAALDMPRRNTREGRNMTGTLVSGIVLQLLSYVAQTEREFIRQRQAEGIAAAPIRGVRFGPDRIPMPERFGELPEDRWSGCARPPTRADCWGYPARRSPKGRRSAGKRLD